MVFQFISFRAYLFAPSHHRVALKDASDIVLFHPTSVYFLRFGFLLVRVLLDDEALEDRRLTSHNLWLSPCNLS